MGRIIIIGRHDADRRLPAHGLQGIKRRITGGGRGRGRILRIERKQQNPVTALIFQRLQARGDGRLPVAHRPVNHIIFPPLLRQMFGQFFRLTAGDGFQRRFVQLMVPDGFIGRA